MQGSMVEGEMSDCSMAVTRLLVDLGLLFLTAALAQPEYAPPTLARQLRRSYRIDPAVYPLFTKCNFDGKPEPIISWTLNSTLLSNEEQNSGPFYSTTAQGAVLNLSKATAADSGIYTCIATNTFGSASESTTIIIQGRAEVPIWVTWWMLFVYALVAWILCSLCLILLYVYRRRTTEKKPPPLAAPNTDDYSYYETEYDNSPRYIFANVHANDEMPAMTTFNQGSEFRDGPSLEATGYLNPAFQS